MKNSTVGQLVNQPTLVRPVEAPPADKPIAMCTVGELQAAIRAVMSSTGTWVSQCQSVLGRCRHAAVVRRRIDAGLQGAAIVGRNYLLSPEALEEELATVSRRRPPKKSPAPTNITEELDAALRAAGCRQGAE